MWSRSRPFMIILLALVSVSGTAQAAKTIHLHLPRQVRIEDSTITLGQVCVLLGPSAQVNRLNDLKLGRLFSIDQTFIVNRAMLISRLVSQGVDPDAITITGAKQVEVRRQSRTISDVDLTEQARRFLLQRLPHLDQCVLVPVHTARVLKLSPNQTHIRIEPILLSDPDSRQLRVRMVVNAGLQEIDRQDVVFQVRYRTGHLVATAPIPKGQALTPDNVVLQKGLTDHPEDVLTEIPYGKIVTTAVDPNSIIRPQILKDDLPPVLLKRNSSVVIRVYQPGLRITAMGTVLNDGRTGQVVKVRNNDSLRVILCKVNQDGSVEPVL